MTFTSSLADIQEAIKPKDGGEDFQKIEWMKLKEGDIITARFANELDEDSPSFNEKNGLAVIIPQHVNPAPGMYTRKIACTKATGQCFGCEQAQENPKAGWWPKKVWYTNVLVDDGLSPKKVVIWSRTVSQRTEFVDVVDEAAETGSITNKTWRIKRTGTGKDTRYNLRPSEPDTEEFDWSPYLSEKGEDKENTLFDLERIVPNIPYENQEAFLVPGTEGDESAEVPWDSDSKDAVVEW